MELGMFVSWLGVVCSVRVAELLRLASQRPRARSIAHQKAGLLGLAVTFLFVATAQGEPIAVRYQEGVVRAFPVLRSVTSEQLAQGDFIQVARGDQVIARLIFRFADGSLHDETAVFSQRNVFTLLSYRSVQRGPAFPETSKPPSTGRLGPTRSATVPTWKATRSTSAVHSPSPRRLQRDALSDRQEHDARYRPDRTIVAFTPKPRVVQLQLLPLAKEHAQVGRGGAPRHPLPHPSPARPVCVAAGHRHPRRARLGPLRRGSGLPQS